jgi:KDO2-lipid IV(A) lauroyltransferase
VRRLVQAGIAYGAVGTLRVAPPSVQRRVYAATVRPMLRLMYGARVRDNLSRAFGAQLEDARREEILSEMCRGLAMLPADWTAFARMGPKFFDAFVDGEDGRRRLNDFERRWPGGWIGVTGHVGNWELLGQWLLHSGLRPMGGVIAKRQPNPHLNRLIDKMRGLHGMRTLYRDQPVAEIARLLKNGHSIGIAADQDVVSLPGVFVDFLGKPAYTPAGPARLALSANVPILVGAMLRAGDGYRVQINDPIFPDHGRPKREEIFRLTAEWSRQVEELIRQHPEQWPWFHDRWKTTPEMLESRARRAL